MVANFKLQGMTSLVGVALLMGLSSQYVARICLTISSASVTMSGPKITLSPDSDQLSGVQQNHP
jgi:hypothetical protein